MKKQTTVIRENKQYSSIIKAVISQLGGTDYLQDISNHGISGGFPGFTYCSDTHQFAIKNRKQIVLLLENQADNFGIDIVEMVSGFGTFRNSPMDADDKRDLYKYLGGGKPEQGIITNLMAWYAAEEVANMFCNY